ncbi:MAG TPA: GNAT family N-acetyltransferase [Fimbriimonas sp.]|nr:GNAT family N-acetyltransferase [Fimbriimonas sp.]
MRLITPRLEIRMADFGEGAKLAEYYRENREFLQPYYPKFTREDFDSRAWEATLPHLRSEFDSRRSMRLCLFQGPRLCGVANVTHASQSPRFSATLGYSIAESCQGQGLMKEALMQIVPFAFSRFHLHRLEANYMPRNERSGRLLASLGFVKEGLAREYLLINGVWEDHVLTAKLNSDW